jgi:hypothetical protein
MPNAIYVGLDILLDHPSSRTCLHKFQDTSDLPRMKAIYKSFLECPECMGQGQETGEKKDEL